MEAFKFVLNRGYKAKLASMSAELLDGDLGPRIVDATRSAAPIDTGELVASIGHSVQQEGRGSVLYIAAGLGGLAPYAGFVELGTSRQAAQPYLRPTVFRRWL